VISPFILRILYIGFLMERRPPAAIAMIGAATFLLPGCLDQPDALSASFNHAPITIGAMFILAKALKRTGALDRLATSVLQMAGNCRFPDLL
jgi:Na+/H+ antiporter NhaD/arsenite permease-like protein